MSFLYPTFLFALSAIAIPILIHLFSFRRYRKEYFPSLQFLKGITKEVRSRSKLKHLLVLLSRIAAIAFLVLAFAQPYLPGDKNILPSSGNNAAAIYIDNSFSMEAIWSNEKLLEAAKKKVPDIANLFGKASKIYIATNDNNARFRHPVNHEDLSGLMDEIGFSAVPATLSQVINREKNILGNSGANDKIIFILSDFQKSFTDIENLKPDSSVIIRMVHFSAEERKNLYIDSCWFYSPVRQLHKPEKFFVRVRNASSENYRDLPLKVTVNSRQKAITTFNISEASSAIVSLSFMTQEAGIHHGTVSITDSPVRYDNDYFFSYEIADSVKVLSIDETGPNRYINTVFSTSGFTSLNNRPVSTLNYAEINSYPLVMLNGIKNISSGLSAILVKYLHTGGNLVMFPAPDSDLKSWNDFFSGLERIFTIYPPDTNPVKAGEINLSHEIFRDVFDKFPENTELPSSFYHYPVSVSPGAHAEALIRLLNDDAFFLAGKAGSGKIFLCTSPLADEFTTFPQHAFFVPVLLNIALYSQIERRLFFVTGKDRQVAVNFSVLSPDESLHLTEYDGNMPSKRSTITDIIPELKTTPYGTFIDIHDQITSAGNYNLFSGTTPVQGISFNYDRSESSPSCYSNEEIEEILQKRNLYNIDLFRTDEIQHKAGISGTVSGTSLWKYAVLFSLIFLLVEVALLRFLK
ncbi:MAG: BatA domain-containing protein [Bacteroidetes bacterium]|nr:BatA domain-containing protein [Bacteroidota bacterium]